MIHLLIFTATPHRSRKGRPWPRSPDRQYWRRRSGRRRGPRVLSDGGPMLEDRAACIKLGIRARHAPRAGGRPGRARLDGVTRRPGVAMVCSAPAPSTWPPAWRSLHRLRPRSSPSAARTAGFSSAGGCPGRSTRSPDEADTKWTERIYDAKRIPTWWTPPSASDAGRPGPVYIDMPGTYWARRARRTSSTTPVRGRVAAQPG